MDVLWEALLIFGLRVLGISISTLSTLMTVQGRKFYAVATGFISTLVYVIAIGKVVSDLGNIWNVAAYCTGFAVGTLLGMAWEQRLALGFAEVRFISTAKGQALAHALREAGYGVTELYGYGKESMVGIVEAIVPRKNVETLLKIARSVDDDAVVTVREARTVQHGYWRPARR
ncbi:MAG TPA: DUF2179 domain-containing protein [Chloroflexi bacterium]|nr:DUF2179 domain-containing protein [Chloroflexota bacterium]